MNSDFYILSKYLDLWQCFHTPKLKYNFLQLSPVEAQCRHMILKDQKVILSLKGSKQMSRSTPLNSTPSGDLIIQAQWHLPSIFTLTDMSWDIPPVSYPSADRRTHYQTSMTLADWQTSILNFSRQLPFKVLSNGLLLTTSNKRVSFSEECWYDPKIAMTPECSIHFDKLECFVANWDWDKCLELLIPWSFCTESANFNSFNFGRASMSHCSCLLFLFDNRRCEKSRRRYRNLWLILQKKSSQSSQMTYSLKTKTDFSCYNQQSDMLTKFKSQGSELSRISCNTYRGFGLEMANQNRK